MNWHITISLWIYVQVNVLFWTIHRKKMFFIINPLHIIWSDIIHVGYIFAFFTYKVQFSYINIYK